MINDEEAKYNKSVEILGGLADRCEKALVKLAKLEGEINDHQDVIADSNERRIKYCKHSLNLSFLSIIIYLMSWVFLILMVK